MLKFSVVFRAKQLFSFNHASHSVRNFWYGVSYIHPNLEPGIYPYPKRQVNEKGKMSFAERIKELQNQNGDIMQPIDIGLPKSFLNFENVAIGTKLSKTELEAAARNRSLHIDVAAVNRMWNSCEEYLSQKCRIIEHYGIFNDLFDAPHYFNPIVHLNVSFDNEHLVHLGNCISPQIANKPPKITFDYPGRWTVLMTCPDEHLTDNNMEYVHWLYTVDSTTNSMKEIVPYLPPIPPRGTGFHRYVCLLFKHEDNSNVSYEEYNLKNSSLDGRTFSTYDFYKKYQDDITPAGLAFFQSKWDSSVRDTYHTVLNMNQPQFQFNWPREYRPPQQKFPAEEAFDLYLDQYRDVKEINEEVLKERLKLSHPFDGPQPKPKYPNAVPLPKDMPSWLKEKEIKKRLRQGVYKDLL